MIWPMASDRGFSGGAPGSGAGAGGLMALPPCEVERVPAGPSLPYRAMFGSGAFFTSGSRVVGASRLALSLKGMGALVTNSATARSEEHTSELQSRENLVCRLLLEK